MQEKKENLLSVIWKILRDMHYIIYNWKIKVMAEFCPPSFQSSYLCSNQDNRIWTHKVTNSCKETSIKIHNINLQKDIKMTILVSNSIYYTKLRLYDITQWQLSIASVKYKEESAEDY